MGDQRDKSSQPLADGVDVQGYVIESLAGWGRQGPVYRARSTELDAIVALKEYLPQDLCKRNEDEVVMLEEGHAEAFERGREEFLEQARQLAQLSENGCVPDCLDFFLARGTAFSAMEHVDGPSLAEELARKELEEEALDEEELVALMRPLLVGLAGVHEAGLQHGCINPSNVLLRRTGGGPVLIGFGWKAGMGGPRKAISGGYAAIEQVSEGTLGPWTDIYAVGALMWRVVASGNPPWQPPEPVEAQSRMDALIRRQPDPLPTAMQIGAGQYSDQMLAAIDKCLRLPEAERVQDCAELQARLAERESTPESDEPAGPGHGHSAAGSRRWLDRMVEAGFTLGALLLGLSVSLVVGRPDPEPAEPASFGRLAIETEPDDARVRLLDVDGNYWPEMLLPEGEYQVEVSADGFESRVLSVRHESPLTTEPVSLDALAAERAPDPAAFQVKVEPATATVRFLGIQEQYRDGMTLAQGTYRLEVSAEGYETKVVSIQHGADPTDETVSLSRVPVQRRVAPFTVDVEPASARVRILNIRATYRPGMSLPEGTYQVEVTAEGYLDFMESVRHGPDASTEQITLQRKGSSLTIEVDPEGAQISFLDIDDRYSPGMTLPEGEYKVEISADGFETLTTAVKHGVEPTVERVALNKLAAVPSTFEFVRIPAGEFTMGSESSEAEDDERPLTRVFISTSFEMSRYEVTQEEWGSVMLGNPSTFANCGSSCPVENVSWEDVQEFLKRLNAADSSVTYRLPTEAEWEYAARAGTLEDRYDELEKIAWWDGNAGFGTHPIGRKAPNPFGLYDMVGNVYEWVEDSYGEYPGGAVIDIKRATSDSRKVARGGGWSGDARACRSTNRYVGRSDVRSSFLGFRLVRE